MERWGMKTRTPEIRLLEKAFVREISAAIGGISDIYQTKNKLAAKLVKDGLLMEAKDTLPGRFPVTIEGYRLTHAGRYLYCSTC